MKKNSNIIQTIINISSLGVLVSLFIIAYLGLNYYQDLSKYTEIRNTIKPTVKKFDNVTLVNYAAGNIVQYVSRDLLNKSAHDHGIDQIFSYSPRDLDAKFYEKNKAILNQKRLAGYALWKPYIILDAMRRTPENQIILYMDGDTTINSNITTLNELVQKHSRLLFYGSHSNLPYTKRDSYILMNCDRSECYNTTQIESGFLVLINNQKNREFVQEWLNYCQDPRIITDQPSELGKELPEFVDHRHEQAILTLLALKYDANDQLILTLQDRLRLINNDNNKILRKSWKFYQKYYKNYNENVPLGPFDTTELNELAK